jgi:hypothetical protein
MRKIGLSAGMVLAVLAMGLWAGSAQAVDVYTNQADWTTALGGATVFLEDFNDTTLNTGLSIVSTYPDFSINGTVPGKMLDQVDDAQGFKTTVTFDKPMTAAGGFWDLAGPGGPGSNIYINLLGGGTQFVGEIPKTTEGTFWGFTTTTPFTSIIISEGSLFYMETYTLENFQYAAVPEPGTLLLLGSGLMGVILIRRKI